MSDTVIVKRQRVTREAFYDAVLEAEKEGLTKKQVAEKLGLKNASFNARWSSMVKSLREADMDIPKLRDGRGGFNRKGKTYAEIAKERLSLKLEAANSVISQ